ncbi:hypothetical protein FHR83_008031 [Actinoplanes campanulatus]|uniref:Uncharacterized protein n=1 Tax=Actinoplanes campanulatus TaxID=113559 RepID=A0A7W5AR47_9ACTN|nr:hypothetical protein [Actinoplanes campanulatus]MBB3100309.1 hypothetical protein [Actinoplanes campanulatus]GGN43933.1 hypothetical protein GCM10010109_76610 [Actinoplanes campanulatus]GID40889.1 hypothetical protein Aca09nite_73950 [Actinoplanes campanulatus]
MTARPHGFARAGRESPAGLVAVVMIVLLLAAAALFSAASAHHAAGGHVHIEPTTGAVVAVHHHETVHEHQHGNTWTPHLTQRIRVTADAVLLAVISAVPALIDQGAAATGTAAAAPGSPLSLLGVLRI